MITRLAGMEKENLRLGSKADQAELLHRVLASTDEDAMAEALPVDPDGLTGRTSKSGGGRAAGFVRRPAQMSSLSGADDAIYMDTSSAAAAAAKREKARERHPLFKLFRR